MPLNVREFQCQEFHVANRIRVLSPNRTDVGSLYDAACFQAVAAALQAKTPVADAARLAKDDADKSMEWLTKAVAAAYKDVEHMKKDIDLDPLRERDDFKKLIAELDNKTEKK